MQRIFNMLFCMWMPFYKGGKGGGGGGGGDQIVTNVPWDAQQPYLKDIFGRAEDNADNPPQYFPNATYVPFSPQTDLAMQLTQNRALQGSELTQSGKGVIQNTIDGDYLNGNPYLDQQYDRAASSVTRNFNEAVAPSIDAKFSKAGRFGSGFHANNHDMAQDNLGRTLSGMASNMYGENYANERKNQLNAVQAGQGLAQNDYNELGQLANIGGALEGKAGDMLNDNIDRFNYYQNLDNNQLDRYSSIVQGLGGYGTQTTSQEGGGGFNAGGALGGALQGYGLASQLGGGAFAAANPSWAAATGVGAVNPWLGAGLGAVAGLLF